MRRLFGLLSIILAGLGFSPGAASAQQLGLPELKSALGQVPIQTPTMLDEETRLDKIEGGYNEAVYSNTLVNYSYDQLDPAVFFEAIAAPIRQTYCSDSTMQGFREAGVAMLHIYYDKNGALIGTVKTNLSHCE